MMTFCSVQAIVLGIAIAGVALPVVETNTPFMEIRDHARLELEGNVILATSIHQASVAGTEDHHDADAVPRRTTAITIVEDAKKETRYTAESHLDLDEGMGSHQFRVEIAGREEFTIRVEYHAGFSAKNELELWVPAEPCEQNSRSFVYNVNGRVWEFRAHEILVGNGIMRLEQEISSLGMHPDESVIASLRKLSEYLAHRGGGFFCPSDTICLDFMPSFVADQCHSGKIPEPRWEPLEKNCDFDASFGFPCLSGTIALDSESNDLASDQPPLVDPNGPTPTPVAEPTPTGESAPDDGEFELALLGHDIRLGEDAFSNPAVATTVARGLAMRGVRVTGTSAGTCPGYLLVQATVDDRSEMRRVVSALAEEVTRAPENVSHPFFRAIEMEMVSSGGNPMGTLRMTREKARLYIDGEATIDQLLVGNLSY